MAQAKRVIGPISAYAIAVANGYTGTEQQFATEIANASTNAQTAATAATKCENLTASLPDDFTDVLQQEADTYNGVNGSDGFPAALRPGVISSTGYWTGLTNGCFHICLPVNPSDTIKILAGSRAGDTLVTQTRYSFLASDNSIGVVTEGVPADFAPGETSRHSVPVGQGWVTDTVPAGTNLLCIAVYVFSSGDTYYAFPAMLKINGVEMMYNIRKGIERQVEETAKLFDTTDKIIYAREFYPRIYTYMVSPPSSGHTHPGYQESGQPPIWDGETWSVDHPKNFLYSVNTPYMATTYLPCSGGDTIRAYTASGPVNPAGFLLFVDADGWELLRIAGDTMQNTSCATYGEIVVIAPENAAWVYMNVNTNLMAIEDAYLIVEKSNPIAKRTGWHATQNIEKKGLFLLENGLYKASSAIAKDAQITVGTNCEKTNVADEISDAVTTASWYKGILPSGSDLNDIQETGCYCIGDSSFYTYTNKPFTSGGVLEVIRISSLTYRQIAETMTGSHRYGRYYSFTTSRWYPNEDGSWGEIY